MNQPSTGFAWSGLGVLVTGATGFVGGWLAGVLADRGARVVALVRDDDPLARSVHPDLWLKAVLVPGDVTDRSALRRALAEYDVRACFHLAAQAHVEAALADPASTFDSNVRGTWTTLEACRESGVERVVVVSSDKAYGEQARLPYDESAPLLGAAPYDASKAAADLIARSYAHTFDLPIGVTRAGNLYGPGDLDPRRIVPGTIVAGLTNRRPVIRSDGTPERDYLFVGDVVEGYLALAERLDDPAVRGNAFNFGSGTPVPVLDLVRLILKLCGSDAEPDVRGTARAEISRQYLSSEKARRLLGWEPATSLDEGLRTTIAWYRDHLDLLRPWRGI
jgi:CDP-glucose 4,6-dehydratase